MLVIFGVNLNHQDVLEGEVLEEQEEGRNIVEKPSEDGILLKSLWAYFLENSAECGVAGVQRNAQGLVQRCLFKSMGSASTYKAQCTRLKELAIDGSLITLGTEQGGQLAVSLAKQGCNEIVIFGFLWLYVMLLLLLFCPSELCFWSFFVMFPSFNK